MLECLCVGDELLDGRTRDINAYWLGQQLALRGLALSRVSVVGDAQRDIVTALRECQGRARYLLVTGGLGPTDDDRTRFAAATWAAVSLREDAATLEQLRRRYAERNFPFPETNRRQTWFPEGAEILPTEVGTAAGFRLRVRDLVADFVPGVPHEFRWFVERHWLPLLGGLVDATAVKRRWRFFGLGESQVGEAVEQLAARGLSIHYTARFPEVHLYVRATGADAAASLDAFDADLRGALGAHLIGVGETDLAELVGQRLQERGWRITTAESCTGGQVAQALTAVAGSSAWFDEAVVVYANSAKIERLGVPAETLEQHGAVSTETALAMARGARSRAGAELSLAITGIAGPSGGSDAKPVGTVNIALGSPEGTFHRRFAWLRRSRTEIRTLATWAALTAALYYLEHRLPADWERHA